MGHEQIEVVDYDPDWAVEFEKISETIRDNLDGIISSMEHVGSTAVPGLCAKPVLDIDVVIKDRSLLSSMIKELSLLGYEYQGEMGIEDREVFKRLDDKVPWDGDGTKQDHNLYVCPKDSEELNRHLAFRDHMRDDPEARKEYCRLKKRLARSHPNDIEAYTDAKSEFIENILDNKR